MMPITRRRAGSTAAAWLLAGFGPLLTHRAHADDAVDYFRAIDVDNVGAVQRLFAGGFDPNTRDAKGQHGLFLALRGGSLKVAKVLAEHAGTRVDDANASGETPLMMAALRGQIDAMAALVARGAAIRRDGWTPLHYAASGPSVDALRWLLDRGAEVDARAPNGNTALTLAARWGHEANVWLLLERGADRTLRNRLGDDAAASARRDGRDNLAQRIERWPSR